MLERAVEQYFVDRVLGTGGEVRKCVWSGRNGAPDRFAFWKHGAHAWAEIKRPGGTLDPHQVREIARMRDAKLPVFVLTTREEVDNFIWSMTGQ